MEKEPLIIELELENGEGVYSRNRYEIMKNASQYCDFLWIDGKPFDLSQDYSGSTYARIPAHHYKYQLKTGIDFIPKEAFASDQIFNIILPEGLKKLQNGCFRSCHFKGDLILPDSLERICADALDCRVDGTFYLPSTVKYVGSLPEREVTKKELILPEGMVSFTPSRIIAHHLYIPSTMRECRARGGCNILAPLITIAPNNPYLGLKDGRIIDLQKGKRDKLRELEKLKKKYCLESVLNPVGLTFSFWNNSYEIRIPIDNTHKLFFPRRAWDTKGGVEKVKNIALKLKQPFAENPSLSSLLSIHWRFNDLLNKPELFQKELSSEVDLSESIGGHSCFYADLSNMGFSIVDELGQFSQKIIDTIEELHKEYGTLYMELY